MGHPIRVTPVENAMPLCLPFLLVMGGGLAGGFRWVTGRGRFRSDLPHKILRADWW